MNHYTLLWTPIPTTMKFTILGIVDLSFNSIVKSQTLIFTWHCTQTRTPHACSSPTGSLSTTNNEKLDHIDPITGDELVVYYYKIIVWNSS